MKAHLTEPRWQEVFLLIAGLILEKQQTSDFFREIAQVAKDFLQTQLGKKFVPVLIWADRMTTDSVNSPIKPPGRRAIAYAYAYAYSYAEANAEANANAEFIKSLITLAELFQQDQIFSTVNYQLLMTKLREEQNFLNTKTQLTKKEFKERIQAIFQVWN